MRKSIRITLIIILILAGLILVKEFFGNFRKAPLTNVPAVNPEVTATIIEGWNLKEIDNYLATNDWDIKGKLSDLKVKDYSEAYSFLKEAPRQGSLEGYLFPDTYRLYSSSTSDQLAIKMLNNFQAKISSDMLAEIKKQNRSLRQVIIMASILEKEVKSEEDMKIVSGIFWRRISGGQPLESCATLAYILGEKKAQYSLADTKIDSPYNTYKNYGLPPGPINNPGLRAITAAIYPTPSNYNYFLSDPETGKTIFSRTYDEHLKNKYKYLK